MNLESNRRIVVALSEEQMYVKLEQLKEQGYSESDIHVVSKEHSHMSTLNSHSQVSTHEAGTMIEKFKSWFTGEDAIKEGFRKLDLSDAETECYSKDVANGAFVLYTDREAEPNEDVLANQQIEDFEVENNVFDSSRNSEEPYPGEERPVQPSEPNFKEITRNDASDNKQLNEKTEPQSEYAKAQGFEPSTNDLVNKTDGRFDEVQDRFERGETFSTNPYLAKDENHIGHSMEEENMVQNKRPTEISNEQRFGFQSQGADPNLGPGPEGLDSNSNELHSGDDEQEDIKTNQYEERLDSEKLRSKMPLNNKIL
ncbi:general stress protein [Paenisporosarcina sp. TG-14]|uniref:general stress protein n=1 Tax=Paenisporosarcina sp. TG-14 TaxID=1231057 RepID=UPI0002DB0B3A|nr:general stress protein [Paenisporosarcina sp. TG-14]